MDLCTTLAAEDRLRTEVGTNAGRLSYPPPQRTSCMPTLPLTTCTIHLPQLGSTQMRMLILHGMQKTMRASCPLAIARSGAHGTRVPVTLSLNVGSMALHISVHCATSCHRMWQHVRTCELPQNPPLYRAGSGVRLLPVSVPRQCKESVTPSARCAVVPTAEDSLSMIGHCYSAYPKVAVKTARLKRPEK